MTTFYDVDSDTMQSDTRRYRMARIDARDDTPMLDVDALASDDAYDVGDRHTPTMRAEIDTPRAPQRYTHTRAAGLHLA